WSSYKRAILSSVLRPRPKKIGPNPPEPPGLENLNFNLSVVAASEVQDSPFSQEPMSAMLLSVVESTTQYASSSIMPLNRASISIIIVNYNTKRLLQDCLSSLMENEGTAPEIIVVDNASTDGSAEMTGAHFPGVVLIRNQQNVGFSKANNQGMRI